MSLPPPDRVYAVMGAAHPALCRPVSSLHSGERRSPWKSPKQLCSCCVAICFVQDFGTRLCEEPCSSCPREGISSNHDFMRYCVLGTWPETPSSWKPNQLISKRRGPSCGFRSVNGETGLYNWKMQLWFQAYGAPRGGFVLPRCIFLL